MWLLYVTFEDFICLSYPEQSASVLSTRVEVNKYLNTQTITATKRKSKKRPRDSPDKATGETCEVYSRTSNLVDEHQNLNKFKLSIGEVICYHYNQRFARKRRLNRAGRNNSSFDGRIDRVHGVKDLNSIGSDLTDMPYRQKDRMHERRKKDIISNVTLTKDYGFGNSWRTRQSGDITNKNCRLTDNLVNHNDFERTPKNINLVDNRVCQHDNPALKSTNRCLNRPADQFVGIHSGLSPCQTYPQEGIHNNHFNLSCSATNTPLSLKLPNDLDRRNNILNVSAFNHGDSKSARFRLKLDLNKPVLLRSSGRHFSNKQIFGASGNNTSDLNRSASFDNVLTPEAEMPSKALSCESSPVTISSGYESDSMPTNEADIDNIFVQSKKKENKRPVPPMDLPIDYFSMSDSHPSPHGQTVCTGAIVTRKPETVNAVRNESSVQLQQNNPVSKETRPPVQTLRERNDNQNPARFSPVQINNFQLKKVARSMFEIIHDLQTDNDQENKAKSRKPKRQVQIRKDRTDVRSPVNNCENTVNNKISQQENCVQFREGTKPTPMSAPAKVSVRCLRRPLGSDPSFHNRQMLPHSSEFDRQPNLPKEYPDLCMSNRTAPPVEFSRQFSEPEIRNCDINLDNFQMNHSFDSRDMRHQIMFSGCAPYATTKLPGCSPYATARLPGCHTPRRDEKEDHVYETIPGDDLLQYEEILRMRLQGLLPRYNPPALPARNINDRKMSEPTRNNFNPRFREQQQNIPDSNPQKQNIQTNSNIVSTTSHEQNQPLNKPRSYSYDPSDSSKTVPNEFFSKWSAAELLNYIDGIRQPPPKRRENFYFLLDSKQKRACFSESLEIENKIKGMGINLEESRRPRLDEDGYTTMDGEPSTERNMRPFCGGLQNMQSTYV